MLFWMEIHWLKTMDRVQSRLQGLVYLRMDRDGRWSFILGPRHIVPTYA